MPVKVQIDGLGIVEFDDAFRDMDEAQRQSVLAEVVEQQQQPSTQPMSDPRQEVFEVEDSTSTAPPMFPPMSDQGAADLKDKVENTPWYEALYHEVNKHRHNALFGMSEGVGVLGSELLNLFGANIENPLGAEKPSPLRDIAGLASGVTPEEHQESTVREVSRIGSQLVPVGAGLSAVAKIPKVASALSKSPKVLNLAAGAALTDFLALTGDEPGIADMLADSGMDSPLLITKKKEGESEWMGRLKNAAEALAGLGAAAGIMKTAAPIIRKTAAGLESALSKGDKVWRPIVSRMEDINKHLGNRMHKFELDQNLLRQEYVDRILPFSDHYNLMTPATQKTLQRLSSNEKTMPKAFEMLEKLQKRDDRFAGVVGEFAATRSALDDLHALQIKNGIEVPYRKGYMPRVMDYEKYMKSFGKKPPSQLKVMEGKALQKKLDEMYAHMELDPAAGSVKSGKMFNAAEVELDSMEKAEVLRDYFEGRRPAGSGKTGYQKARTIDAITGENQMHYSDMLDGLQDYVNNATYKVTRNRFTGKGAGGMEKSIFADITAHAGDRAQEAADLVQKRLAGGERRVGKGTNIARNFIYATTIGNPWSTITQLGDMGMNAYRNGLINTVSPFGPKVKLKDFGLNDIAAEFTDAGAMKGAMDKLFRGTGFKQLDVAMKQNNMRGALRQAKKQLANKGSRSYKKFIEENRPYFEGETDDLVNALKRNDMDNENVKLFLFTRLSKTQPISLSEMPEAYLNMRRGRLAYALKTFTIKQVEVVRADILRKLAKKETMKEGMQNAARLAVLFGGGTTGINIAKDFMLGRPVDVKDSTVDALMQNIGISKHAIYKGKNDGIIGFGAAVFAPPAPVLNEAIKVAFSDDKEEALQKQSGEMLKYLPGVGRDVYWRIGPGVERIKKERLDKLKGRD
jgi:hypothetical protein